MIKQTFDFSVDIMKSILWQYNDAEKLQAILQNKQNWLDANADQFWQDWYTNIFDLRTANEFGLSVWSIILGVSFTKASEIPTLIFGFDGSGGLNFGHGVFMPTQSTVLTKEQKRNILQLRYRQMTSNATINEIQDAINNIFPGAKILDGQNMTIVMTYPTIPNSDILYILKNYDVIPRPATVELETVFGYSTWFGFDGSGGLNFNNGNFGR